jgi:hypothetical protein
MSRNKSSLSWTLIAGAAIAGASFVGVADYVRATKSQSIEAQTAEDKAAKQTSEAGQQASQEDQKSVKTLRRNANDELELTGSKKIADGENSKTSAIQQSLTDLGYDKVRVVGISLRDGNAIIDLNSAVFDGFGSGQEADFINAIKLSLSQFKDVDSFQLRVDGEVLQSLSHFEMIEPIKVR